MVTKVGGVAIEIRGDDAHFDRTMREVRREAGRTGQTMSREFRQANTQAKALNTTLRSTVGSVAAMAAALGAGVGLASGIRSLADFGQAMSTVKAITQATDSQFVLLEEKAKLLGATTRFSASQAAEGMLFLARAGFNVDAVLGSIEGTLQLAQAGALDLGRAADIASNILTGFRLNVDQTGRVVDVLAKIANSANTDIGQLGEAMKFVAPVAAGLGVSLEEAAAAVGSLSDAGLQSSLAGTGLRRILSELESPASKSVRIFSDLGVSIDEVRPSAVGLIPALQRLADAGLDTGLALEVFGDRGGPAFEVLASSLPKVIAQTKALNEAGGTAERVSVIMDDNLNGAILSAVSAFEALILAFGKAGADQALQNSFRGLADLLRLAARNTDILGVAVVALATRAILPMAVTAVPAAIGALRTLAATLVLTQGAAARAAVVMNLLGGPLTLAVAGAAVAYVALSRSVVTTNEALGTFNDVLTKAQDTQQKIAKDTDALKAAQERLTAAIREQGSAAAATGRQEIDAIVARIAKNKQLLQVYETQARAALRAAEQGSRVDRGQLARGLFGNVEGNRFVRENRGTEQFDARIQGTIDGFLAEADAAAEAGRALSAKQRRQLDLIVAYQDSRVAIEAARESLAAYGQAASEVGSTVADIVLDPLTTAASEVSAALDDQLASQLALLASLERAQAIEVARAAGNQELVDILSDGEDIQARTLDYMEAGLSVLDATRRAEEDIRAIREARSGFAEQEAEAERERALALQQYEEFFLRRKEQQGITESAAAAEEEVRQRIADGIARGLEDGIRSGNWGEAFRGIVASNVSSALSEAINDLASELLSLFRGAFSGGGNFGGIGSIFGGGRASGGAVRAGMRYMVGEQGPEMFVPTVPGVVVPKFEGPASAASGGVPGMQSLSISAPLIIQGSVTEDVLPRVQAMMAAQARELPRVIDARVSDSIRRNRY